MPLAKESRTSLARKRRRERKLSDTLERLISRTEALLIGLTIAAIAYGDWLAGRDLSIGFLYLIPLSFSALTQKKWVTAALLVLCVALRQGFGPLQSSPTAYFVRDIALTGIFLSVVATLMRLGQRRREFFDDARSQRDELIEEVRMAAEVQENIIQRNQPPETPYDIVAQMEPARVVGGDYYDFMWHQDGTLGIVIADVAGKGLSAAMLMPAVDITTQALVQSYSDPGKALAELNKALYENTGSANYATIFYAALAIDGGRLRYANGGHLPGLLLRADAETPEWLSVGGTPVGLLPGAAFEVAETQIGPGDLLVLYSDGVSEAEDAHGEQFGLDRLVEAALRGRPGGSRAVVRSIRDAVRGYRADEAAADDATVIAVKGPLAGA